MPRPSKSPPRTSTPRQSTPLQSAPQPNGESGKIPLAALFGKAEAANVQVSPQKNWLSWLARCEGGVLNLWVAALPLAEADGSGNSIPGARQLTNAAGRDLCFTYRFTRDDRRILYLRETEHGSELYHLYCVELSEAVIAPTCGRDLLAAHPTLTCAVGFVGGLQLWLPPAMPHNVAVLSTGRGSLLWDLSQLDLDSGKPTTLERNPWSSATGKARLLVALCAHLLCHGLAWLLRLATLGRGRALAAAVERAAPPPSAPVQWFVGRDGRAVGRAEAAVGLGLWLRLCRRTAAGRFAPVCDAIPFGQLNMQLVGAGAATGLLRLDVLGAGDDGAVAVHTCVTGDTTAYVKYPGGEVLASHPSAECAAASSK